MRHEVRLQLQSDVKEQRPASGVHLSACIQDADSHEILVDLEARRVLPIASVGKLLLLLEVAHQIELGELSLTTKLARAPQDIVADSGLWQYLSIDSLPVQDIALLVGSVSDNLATNVLLRRVGLASVQSTARSVGLNDTILHDQVRSKRMPGDPLVLATGSAYELANLMARLNGGEVISPSVSELVLRWLAPDADLSMVSASFGLDPLAHVTIDRGLLLRHKTGTDSGVRADVGLLRGSRGSLAYAVICSWDPSGPDRRDVALQAMHAIGRHIRIAVDEGLHADVPVGTEGQWRGSPKGP